MGSPRVYKALKDTLAKTLDEMHRLTSSGEFNERLANTITIVANILDGMNHDSIPIENEKRTLTNK